MIGDVGSHRWREVFDFVRPRDRAELRDAIGESAARGLAVYPLSTGRNWGLGSRWPTKAGCRLVELDRMIRIRNLDLERGYAVVEPGVTQRKLAESLSDTGWMLNVTEGCADTSVLGNVLDRGHGAVRPRTQDLLGLEVMTPDGAVLTTGGLDGTGCYRGRVAGPDLTQMFVQASFGVVTAMAIELIPRPECARLASICCDRGDFPQMANAVSALCRRGLPTLGVPKLAGLHLGPSQPSWDLQLDPDVCYGLIPMLGSDAALELALRLLEEAPGDRTIQVIDPVTAKVEDPFYAISQAIIGKPQCTGIERAFGCRCDEVDDGEIGCLTLLPLVPLNTGSVEILIGIVEDEAAKHDVSASLELRVDACHTASAVIHTVFERSATAQVDHVHAFRDDARQRLIAANMLPYRSDVDRASVEIADRDDNAREFLTALKAVIDPRGLMSPGRYV